MLNVFCSLRVQKLSEKHDKRTFVYCSEMPYFPHFFKFTENQINHWGIFNSRTGHHTQGSEMTLNRHF